MRFQATFWLLLTTLLLLTVLVLTVSESEFLWVFLISCIGQLLLLVTVYKVLREDYHTDKTFDDFYEDRPDLGAN